MKVANLFIIKVTTCIYILTLLHIVYNEIFEKRKRDMKYCKNIYCYFTGLHYYLRMVLRYFYSIYVKTLTNVALAYLTGII